MKRLFVATFIVVSTIVANAQTAFYPDAAAFRYARQTMLKMSVEEKVGQLVHVGINARFANRDSPFFRDISRQVTENKIGGIIFFGAPVYETAILANRMQSLAKVPLLMSVDAETGIGMRFDDTVNFPWAMAVAATGRPEFAEQMGSITGREARAMGIHHVFAPVVDLNNNADNPVINVRSFGEDPMTASAFGAAFIRGLQRQKVLGTAKHFPGHGDTSVDSHRGLPTIDASMERLRQFELVPFKAAIDAGVASVMVGHIALPQIDNEPAVPLADYKGGDAEAGAEIKDARTTVPATLSRKIQTDLLRNEMGFRGLIVTDAMSMSGLTLYYDQAEAGVRAVLAGADIMLTPQDTDAMVRGLIAAVRSSRITQKRLDESVERILAWKHASGAVARPIAPIDEIDTLVSGRETAMLADAIAARAITLVRYNGTAIPLDRVGKVVVLGVSNGFEGPSIMSAFTATLRAEGVKFTSAYLQENSTPAQVEAATNAVRDADIVVAGLFGRVRSGERRSVGIPENGAALLRELLAANKNVIGVSFGNPYILSSFPELKSYLVAYGDMPSLQRAAARALTGKQDITGRLPITLPGSHERGVGLQIVRRK
jgi:beta-N-acetylhexosaminidase